MLFFIPVAWFTQYLLKCFGLVLLSISCMQGTSEPWDQAPNIRFLEGLPTQLPIRTLYAALPQWLRHLLAPFWGQEHCLPGAWLLPSEKSFALTQKPRQRVITHTTLTTGLAAYQRWIFHQGALGFEKKDNIPLSLTNGTPWGISSRRKWNVSIYHQPSLQSVGLTGA